MARRKRGDEDRDSEVVINDDGTISEVAADASDGGIGGTGINGAEAFTDPASVGTDGGSVSGQPAKRGRGRPKGSGGKQKAETVRSIGVDGVAGILLTIHSTLAVIARAPEFELSESEADKIAKASVAVAKLYNLETTEKATAWANLIGVVGAAYVPRFIAMGMRKKMEAAERTQSPNVTQFPIPGAPSQPRMN